VPAAAALVGGILLADGLGGGMVSWCAVAAASAAAWIALRLAGVVERWLLLPLLVLLAAAGAARYRATVEPPPDDVARLVAGGPRPVTLEGTVVESARQTSPPADVFLPSRPYYLRSRMMLNCDRALVAGRWYAASGRIQTTIRQPIPEGGAGVPNLGDRVQVLGRLALPAPPANPGAFDMPAYLHRQGVRACLSTEHWEALKVVEPGADRVRSVVGAIQRWGVRRLDGIRSEEGRAVAAAVVLGRRDLLRFDAGEASAQDVEQAFIVTGTAHYLAVSGFNVGLAAAVVLLLARLLGLGPRPTAVLVGLVVLAYVLMTELEPPVVRAAVLIGVLCLGGVLGRPALQLNSLAAAVLVILVLRPGDLFTTSLQLSFAVVLGMFWLVPKVERMVFRRQEQDELGEPLPERNTSPWVRHLRQTVAISLAAAAVAIPLVAYRFHLVGWLAPIGSVLLAAPMFGLMAGSMVLMVLTVPVPWIVDLLAAVPDGMARAIVGITTSLARVPGGHFYIAEFSGTWLIVAYGLLAAWAWRERLGVPRRRLATAALTAAALFVWTGGHRPPARTRAMFLSVGSGNTNLIELPNGRNLLYDAGSSLTHVRAAQATIAPALWSRGIERVDAVFISHAHFDHFKDILPLADQFGVRQVFVPPTFLRRRLASDDSAIEALLARGIDVQFFGAGDRLAGTGGVDVRAVWPRGSRSMTRRINDGSLVLAVADGQTRLLLAGDIERQAIDGLIEAEPDLRADAMLWPHHGHMPEAVGDLVRHTGAGMLVVSSVRPYGPWPGPAWAGERGVRCYHTGVDGAVTVELAPEGVRAETFLDGTGDTVARADKAHASSE